MLACHMKREMPSIIISMEWFHLYDKDHVTTGVPVKKWAMFSITSSLFFFIKSYIDEKVSFLSYF